MPQNIKPSEISDVLLRQLKDIDTSLKFEEVGEVLQVSDGVVRIYGLLNAEANELLEFENGIMAVVMNLEEDNVGAVLLGPTDQIKEGMTVRRTGRIASINAGEGMLGRVVDPLGVPLDGRGKIGGELTEMPLERKAPGVIFRQPVTEPLQTGLKAIVASALNIKPVMGATPAGTICQLGRARGIKKALVKMVDEIMKDLKDPMEKVLAISHCNCPQRAKDVAEMLKARATFKEIMILDTAGISSMYASDGGVIVVV